MNLSDYVESSKEKFQFVSYLDPFFGIKVSRIIEWGNN